MNTAALNYTSQLPPAIGVYPKGGNVEGTVFFHLLPFMEEDNIYNAYAGSPYGTALQTLNIKTFQAPLDPSNTSPGLTSYAGNALVFQKGGLNIPAAFTTKGTSKTLVFMERYAQTAQPSLTNPNFSSNPLAAVGVYPPSTPSGTYEVTPYIYQNGFPGVLLDFNHYWGYSDVFSVLHGFVPASLSNCVLPYGDQGYPSTYDTPGGAVPPGSTPANVVSTAVYPITGVATTGYGGPLQNTVTFAAPSTYTSSNPWYLNPYTNVPATGSVASSAYPNTPVNANYQNANARIPFPQFATNANAANNDCPHAYTTAGMQCAMGDASVRAITHGISYTTWAVAVDPSSNGLLGQDW